MIKVDVRGAALEVEADHLERCPFCGMLPRVKHLVCGPDDTFWIVECSSFTHSVCAYSRLNGTPEEAVEEWNARYHDGN